jgi:hypothetical protein
VFGRCPEVSFVVDGMMVTTNRNTDFRRRSCDALSSGDRVKGRGTRSASGGAVTAIWIELKKDNDDDDDDDDDEDDD